jgi:hypothetical protein
VWEQQKQKGLDNSIDLVEDKLMQIYEVWPRKDKRGFDRLAPSLMVTLRPARQTDPGKPARESHVRPVRDNALVPDQKGPC